jgi:hypothetical protein
LSGCCGQSCGGGPVADELFDGAQGAEQGAGLGLSGGEHRGQDAVVDLGVEDRECLAVGGEVVPEPAKAPPPLLWFLLHEVAAPVHGDYERIRVYGEHGGHFGSMCTVPSDT